MHYLLQHAVYNGSYYVFMKITINDTIWNII